MKLEAHMYYSLKMKRSGACKTKNRNHSDFLERFGKKVMFECHHLMLLYQTDCVENVFFLFKHTQVSIHQSLHN